MKSLRNLVLAAAMMTGALSACSGTTEATTATSASAATATDSAAATDSTAAALTANATTSDDTAQAVLDTLVSDPGTGPDGGAAPMGEPPEGAPGSGTADGGGPGGFGKNVDPASITTVDELNALIQEAYGQAALGLHRGHQPVEQTLIDTLGISHDEMHVRMEEQGQNLAAIADDLGVGTDTLIAALVDAWQPAIDNLAADGSITADQAQAYHDALVEAFTYKVTWNGTDPTPTFSGV